MTVLQIRAMNSTLVAFSTVAIQSRGGVASTLAGIIAISLAAGVCSLLTVFGNFFVILAFITNRSLRNFSNYLILNLAISDLIIGLFSMNIYAVYNVTEVWTMGSGMCKAWLTVDYVVSNTSVMNLLVICIDRYMAINCPVKYRKRCTTYIAVFVISIAWTISFLLWAPAILLWDVVSQSYSDQSSEGTCSIPFMEQSAAVTLITALGAFYLPAAAMCTLYWRVIVKIERQSSGVSSMISRATNAMSSRYTNSWHPKQIKVFLQKRDGQLQAVNETCTAQNKEATQLNGDDLVNHNTEDRDLEKRKNSCNPDTTALMCEAEEQCQEQTNDLLAPRDCCSDKSSTMLLKREDSKSVSGTEASESHPSVTKSEEDSMRITEKPEMQTTDCNNLPYSQSDKKPRKLFKRTSTSSFLNKNTEARLNREKRATTLLKSILICFISLWLPYNIIVVVSGICASCDISSFMWKLSYWLCYLNSTANPFCYGYCNENFQRTFKALLTNKWWTRKGRREMRCQVGGKRTMRGV